VIAPPIVWPFTYSVTPRLLACAALSASSRPFGRSAADADIVAAARTIITRNDFMTHLFGELREYGAATRGAATRAVVKSRANDRPPVARTRTRMNWLISILVGLCAAILTTIFAGVAADSWSRWLHVSTREGAAGYWVVMMALLGGVISLILGISIARGWLLSTPSFWSALATTIGLTAATTLVITGILWLAADHAPTSDGRPFEVQAELRFPSGVTLEAARNEKGYATIARDTEGDTSGVGYFDFRTAQEIDGRVILPINVR